MEEYKIFNKMNDNKKKKILLINLLFFTSSKIIKGKNKKYL